MKIKHFKRMICFLLAVVVLLSMPLDTTAHAVAVESWVMYALITFMTAMGVTFTVAGGVDAMVQAMEEKVDEFQQKGIIIDFYDEMRKGIRLVPKPEPDPSGNEILDLFFTANVVEAINEFLQWLTNEGGWSNGTVQTDSMTQSTFTALFRPEGGSSSDIVIATSVIKDGVMVNQGTLFELNWNTSDTFVISPSFNVGNIRLNIPYAAAGNSNKISYIQIRKSSTGNVYVNRGVYSGYDRNVVTAYFTDSYTMQDIKSIYFYDGDTNPNHIYFGFQMNDGKCFNATSDYLNLDGKVTLTSDLTIDIPTEIEILSPKPAEGVLLNQDFIGSPDLVEWSQWVEEIFTDTGTIPQPTPQVVQDPDYAPEPTPAPTPVPSPEIEDIEDLGLPTLGEALFNKFPFSLPRDLKRIADILNAEPVAPFWEVDLFAPLADDIAFQGDTTLRIDLTEYEVLGQISRWASVIGFCIMLIIITKGVIKW